MAGNWIYDARKYVTATSTPGEMDDNSVDRRRKVLWG